jgi:hypothetical protein
VQNDKMKKEFSFLLGFVFLLMVFGCVTNKATEVPILTYSPLPTQTRTITPTEKPKPTKTLVPTPTLVFVTLLSPFDSNCGDGVPVVWSNDSYNGRWYPKCNDADHGHVDIFVPIGCNVNNYDGEVIAPVSGFIQKYTFDGGWGYHLFLPDGVLIDGIEEALKFSGIESPNLRNISSMWLDIGHADLVVGKVEKGQVIGDVVPFCSGTDCHSKIAYKVSLTYEGQEYVFTPTLFPNILADGTILKPMLNGTQENWLCNADTPYRNFANSDEDCIPEPHDYAPGCKIP